MDEALRPLLVADSSEGYHFHDVSLTKLYLTDFCVAMSQIWATSRTYLRRRASLLCWLLLFVIECIFPNVSYDDLFYVVLCLYLYILDISLRQINPAYSRSRSAGRPLEHSSDVVIGLQKATLIRGHGARGVGAVRAGHA